MSPAQPIAIAGSPWKKVKERASRFVFPNSPAASSLPFVEYGKWFRFTRFTPDYPFSIDIQTRSGCNARCTFCGVGRESNKVTGAMDDDLFRKIVDEALSFPKLMQINPYLLNDPLVDRKIAEKVEYIVKKRGARRRPMVRLITNAGLLTPDMAYELLHSGLDELNISFHSIIPEVYEDLMRPLKFDKVMENIQHFLHLRRTLKVAKKPDVNVWTVRTRPVEENLANEHRFWKALKVGFKARKLDNRASSTVENTHLSERSFEYVQICPIPFWRAWIMWNGDMIMCCVDQERSNLLGNCATRSIRDIWNDAAYQELRRKWRTRELKGLLCDTCKGT